MSLLIFIGQQVDEKYEVIKRLGESAVGQVYEARHGSLGHKVALKFLDIDSTRREELVKRFQQASKDLVTVDSKHIVRTEDMGELPDGTPYLVRDLLDGEALTEAIRWTGSLTPDRTVVLALQACRALQAAHEKGVLHLDLKPGNLLISRQDDETDFLKVVDFGISIFHEAEGINPNESHYVAPEQLDEAATVDGRADIYALGVIVQEMLTGSPFVATPSSETSSRDATPTLNGRLPKGFETLVARATSADPDDRFPTVKALAEALDKTLTTDLAAGATKSDESHVVHAEVQATAEVDETEGARRLEEPRLEEPVAPPEPEPVETSPSLSFPTADRSQEKAAAPTSDKPSAMHWAIFLGIGLVLATITAVVLSSIDSAGGFDAVFGGSSSAGEDQLIESRHESGDIVDVTVYVMSQCPYAVKTLDALTPLARSFGPRMKLKLHYIGRDQGSELTSMHGENEVQGDKLQLCVHAHAPYGAWLNFLDCQNEQWRQIPEGWERCAERAGVNMDAVRRCYTGQEAEALLRRSFQVSSEAEARGSPTIFVAGERYSGGRSTQAFTGAICANFETNPPESCGDIQPPSDVRVTVLSDRRCQHADCNTTDEERSLKSKVLGAHFSRVDYNTTEGGSLFREANLKMLPAFLVGAEVERDEEASKSITRSYRREGQYFVKSIGRFDPLSGNWIKRPTVRVRQLIDSRCKIRECESVPRFEAFVKHHVPGATFTTIDYVTPEGAALWRSLKTHPQPDGTRELGLPIVLLSKEIDLEEEALSRLKRRLVDLGDEYLFQLGPWNPEGEICDNLLDDDNDDRADCEDLDCAETMACRPERSGQLRVFAMSQCPYGIKVLDAMEEVLANFNRDRSKIDFRLEFVGELRNGELHSMHGEDEVAENLRQICAQHHYGDRYQFMDYVLCRNKNIADTEWEACARGPIKAEIIRQCVEGPQGRRLLIESFELTKSLGFRGSPSWLLNNRYPMTGRDSETIKNEFCAHNELPECSRQLSKR